MKRTKRTFAFLLCVMMVLFTLAGCGAGGKGNNTQETDSKQAAEPAKEEKVKITYSSWGTADELKVLQGAIDKFNALQDKIEVVSMPIPWESYLTKLNTMATAKELPDCGMMQEGGLLKFAVNGMLADVSSMYGANESKPLDYLAYKYQGKPVAYATANEVLLLYYNKDMFDKAGLAYPPTSIDKAWTWDQFVDVAKKLTIDKNGKHPDEAGFDPQNIKQYGCLVENLPWQLETWAISNGGGFYSKDGSKVIIDDPASIEGIQKVADLYLKDHVAPLSTGATDDGIQRSIIAGTCAMATNGAWNVGTCLGSAKKEGLNFGVAVLPYMKDKVTLCTAGANVIFSTSKHQKEAMEWLKWYTQEENSWELISSGVWMPKLDKWYTDESLTHKWVDNPNFPPYADYKSAVVDVAKNTNVARPASWFYVNNTGDFNNLLGSILGDVWTGKTTAEKAIKGNIDKLKAIFNDNK